MEKRHRLQIYADMLTVALNSATKTRIMYRSNLSHRQLIKLLSSLLEKRLITIVNVNPHASFQTTEKGRKWLQVYNQLAQLSQ